MPFGRYQGWRLGDLPNDYVVWLYGLDDLREPLRSAIETEWQTRFCSAQAWRRVPPASVVDELVGAVGLASSSGGAGLFSFRPRNWEGEPLMYRRIGAVARELGISISHLRALERRGLLEPARRDPSGQRRFSDHDVARIRTILFSEAPPLVADARPPAEVA